jgi:hypothetical protein
MNKANFPKKLRYILWQDAFMTTTLLDGLVTTKTKQNMSTEEDTIPNFQKFKIWGEARAVDFKKI